MANAEDEAGIRDFLDDAGYTFMLKIKYKARESVPLEARVELKRRNRALKISFLEEGLKKLGKDTKKVSS